MSVCHPVRAILLLLKLLVFLILLGLAFRNSDLVTVHFFLGMAWDAPLVLVLFAAFATGLIFGLLACSGKWLQYRRELRDLRALRKPEAN